MKLGSLILDFLIIFAATALISVAYFRVVPSPKFPREKRITVIRAFIWGVIVVSVTVATFVFAKSCAYFVLAGYALFGIALLFGFLRGNKEKLRSFWANNIAPCYPFFIVVLIVVCGIYICGDKQAQRKLPEASEESWNDGYERGYEDGKQDGYDLGFDEASYSNNRDYESGYDLGYANGYNDAENEHKDDRALGYEEGLEDGASFDYDAAWSDGYAYGYNYGMSQSNG